MCVCSVTQLCLTLCNPMDCSLPGSSIHGILQERILEWVAMSSSGDLPDSGIEPGSPALQADFLPCLTCRNITNHITYSLVTLKIINLPQVTIHNPLHRARGATSSS